MTTETIIEPHQAKSPSIIASKLFNAIHRTSPE